MYIRQFRVNSSFSDERFEDDQRSSKTGEALKCEVLSDRTGGALQASASDLFGLPSSSFKHDDESNSPGANLERA